MIKGINLLEHPGSGVSRNLVNDLDRELLISPYVPTSPHGCIGSLAKDLTGHNIQILESGGYAGTVGLLFLPPATLGLLLALLKGLRTVTDLDHGIIAATLVGRSLGEFFSAIIYCLT